MGELSLSDLFHAFHRMYHGFIRHFLAQAGMGEVTNPHLLFALHALEGATQRELADQLGIAPPSAAISLGRMEKAGLVKRTPDPVDRRKNRMSLTPKGRALVARCMGYKDTLSAALFEGLEQAELDALRRCYTRMISNLHGLGIRPPKHFCRRGHVHDKAAEPVPGDL